jgi:hypothetical protein
MQDGVKSVLLLLLAAASTAGAQPGAAASLRARRQLCDMSARMIVMRLVDSAGAPLSGAAIAVQRVQTRTRLEGPEAMGGQGDYMIIEDGTLPDLRRGGEPFDVRFTLNGRSRQVRVQIGMDAGGCHVMLKRGPTQVTL